MLYGLIRTEAGPSCNQQRYFYAVGGRHLHAFIEQRIVLLALGKLYFMFLCFAGVLSFWSFCVVH